MQSPATFAGDPCKACGGTTRYKRGGKCVPCAKKRADSWRARNQDRYRAKQVEWRANNAEAHKQGIRDWQIAHRDLVNERQKRYRLRRKATSSASAEASAP